MQGTKLGFVKS